MPRIGTEGGKVVREMSKMDSLIKESLRRYPLSAQGIIREVVKPGGVVTPDGLHLPQGTHVHTIVSTMQRDPTIYGDAAEEFHPLRYYAPDDAEKTNVAVHVRENFLAFGLGKHACPGRFFAVHVVKMVLGYLLMHYDLEPLKERPRFVEFGEAVVPSGKIEVRIRRRKFADESVEKAD